MSKKMTLKEMFAGCLSMWRWLESTGSTNKEGWYKTEAGKKWCAYNEEKKGKRSLHLDCFACQYVAERDKAGWHCERHKCPLHSLWTNESYVSGAGWQCENSNTSPYNMWSIGNKKQRIVAAKIVADYCAKEYKKRLR